MALDRNKKQLSVKRYDQIVARNVRESRIAANYTQSDLANLLGLTCQQIQKYESGANRISSGKLFAIAEFLCLDIIDLYRGVSKQDEKQKKLAQLSDSSLRQLAEIERLYMQIESAELRNNCLAYMRLVVRPNLES